MSESKPRGRPRKDKASQGSEARSRSYWSEDGQVFFNDGQAWATELVEADTTESRKHSAVFPLYLGREEEILAILRGEKAIPKDIHHRRRAVLNSILEVSQIGRAEVANGAFGLQRGGHARATGHRQKDIRRLKAREGLPGRKAHYQGKGVPGR